MNIKMLKNTIIVVLLALSVFLASQLWFENLPSITLFKLNQAEVVELQNFVLPQRLITNFGGNNFKIQYNDLTSSSQIFECDTALEYVLKKGRFVKNAEIDYENLLKKRSYIYEYPFPMPSKVFTEAFGDSGGFLTSRVTFFDSILIIPDTESDKLNVLFVDESAGLFYEYEAAEANMANSIHLSIIVREADKDSDEIHYVSSKLSKFNMFIDNTYIPIRDNQDLIYTSILAVNPYVEREKLLNAIEKNVDVFFDNPSLKQSGLSTNGVFTYSDEDRVVKYYPSDVLEYINYESQDPKSSDLIQDYAAAFGFIMKDEAVLNDFFLAGYDIDGVQTTFYFDPAINNLPIMLTPAMKNLINMEHFIEVTVQKGNVVRYKKLVHYFQLLNEKKAAAVDFSRALIDILDSDDLEKPILTDGILGYNADKDMQLSLFWFFNMDGLIYSKSAQ